MVLGHSFVAHLHTEYKSNFKKTKVNPWDYEAEIAKDLKVDQFYHEVYMKGVGGANFGDKRLPNIPKGMSSIRCVVLDLGTNDLAAGRIAVWVAD